MNGEVLELATLPDRHPGLGSALLDHFGPLTVLRLCLDPVALSSGTHRRDVLVDRVRLDGSTGTETRAVGWKDLPNCSVEVCTRLRVILNDQRITEDAAIGILALLVHELEGGEIVSVLPIGSGGDYLVRLKQRIRLVQTEISGIKEDDTGAPTRARLREKSSQVLTRSRGGYASVTTFRWLAENHLHSYLHYVTPQRIARRKPPRKNPP